jgi:hypothetical protein
MDGYFAKQNRNGNFEFDSFRPAGTYKYYNKLSSFIKCAEFRNQLSVSCFLRRTLIDEFKNIVPAPVDTTQISNLILAYILLRMRGEGTRPKIITL